MHSEGERKPTYEELEQRVAYLESLVLKFNARIEELEKVSADPDFWASQGFACEPIDTAFRFDDVEDAKRLLGFFFGERGVTGAGLEVPFRVGLFHRTAR